jgi:hypothetical protein
MTTNGSDDKLPDKHRRIAVWYRRQAESMLQQAEWHDQRAARLEAGVDVPPLSDMPDFAPDEVSDVGGLGRQLLAVAGLAGLIAVVRKLRG